MQSVKQIVSAPLMSTYKGSERTYEDVREQLRKRFGDDVADEYDPYSDCMTFSSWLAQGYIVRKGQKALKSITIVEVRDKDDKIVKKICRNVKLFHRRQVEAVKV